MRPYLLAIFVFAAACQPGGRDPGQGPDSGQPGDGLELPPPICRGGTRWAPGAPAFRDASSDWGLDAIGAEGVRLTVGDIDGDGLPDVVIRRGGVRADELTEGGARHTWLLRNTGRRFEDVTLASGILQRRGGASNLGRPGEVMAFADVDNDGDLDLYVGLDTSNAAADGQTSELLLNDGTGRFALGAEGGSLRRVNEVDVPAGASFTDFDLDGNVDLWVPQHNTAAGLMQQDRLYRGDGAGGFVDATEAARLTTRNWVSIDDLNAGLAHSRAWGAAACDLNGDGMPELLAPSYGRSPNHLWQAQRTLAGEVIFLNRSVASSYAYDADFTWSDNHFARCFCMENRGAQGCGEVPYPDPLLGCGANWNHTTDREPFRLGGNSGTTICADVNNDGWLDLLTTEIRHAWAGTGSDASELLVNTGAFDVRFDRPGRAATGLDLEHDGTYWDEGHMTAAVFDFDNDGRPDLYLGASDYPGNRGLLFHQAEPMAFVAVPPSEGIDHHRSHGVVVADFDRDGDLDVLVGHSRMRCAPEAPADCYPTQQVRLFENVLGQDGNWLQLSLEGAPGTNRLAVGAQVRVVAGGITQVQEIGGGHGHYGAQNDRVLHFGLGAACEAEVMVRWPNRDRRTQSWTLPAGYRFEVREGEPPRVAENAAGAD